MKKIITTLALAAAAVTGANAQAVLGYNSSESTGTYTALDNPTVIFDGATASVGGWLYRSVLTPEGLVESNGSCEGFSLGFSTDVAGESYTSFLVAPSGYLYLGNGTMGYNTMMGPNFLTYGSEYVNAGFAFNSCDFNESTKISYQSLGSGDDQRLVVQYENYLAPDDNRDYTAIDVQTILYKDGRVQVVFGNLDNLEDDKTLQAYIGVRQYGNYVSANGEWGSLQTVRNDRQEAIFTNATPAGATVTFTTPEACIRPENQPTALELGRTSDEVQGSFTACADADHYLVLYTVGDATAGTPADGTVYKAGEQLGDATVAYYGDKTEFSVIQLAGGTTYNFTVYALNAYGLEGPVYNTESPLTGSVATLPAPAQAIELTASSLNSITFNVTSNEAGDDIVVLYNSYVERDNFGDHGLFGEIPADAKAGDVIPAPADFTPAYDIEGAPLPANAGTVAYIGKAGEVSIDGLAPGTGYYLAVYTRNAAGEYTTEPLYGGYSTYIESPYDGDSYQFPRYHLPLGWSGSENGESTLEFVNQEFFDFRTQTVRQGNQVIQPVATLNRGDITNGKEAWLTLPPVVVNERHCMASFDYCITFGESRFSTIAYNSWAEGDQLQIRLSEDNGETWQVVAAYTDAEHPAQEETLSYVNISADLNDYRGKTVLVQLYWKSFANAPFGCKFYLDRFSMLQGEFPAVPEVTVAKISHDSAVVSWVSQQTDYELAYNVKGAAEATTVKVEGATSYTLTGLEANTEYEVKVRGLLEGSEEAYSEWSDAVTFTTADYPEVGAPENLTVDVEAEGGVLVSWDAATDALSYELAYRLASSTEWIYRNCEETSLLLTGLQPGEDYICKVRAFCTHDRETSYSAQLRFTTPQKSSVEGVSATSAVVTAGQGYILVSGAQGAAVAVYTASGVKVAATQAAAATERYELSAGIYVVTVGGASSTVAVR